MYNKQTADSYWIVTKLKSLKYLSFDWKILKVN